MTTRAPRFEVVRSDAGFFARFRAANGRIVWVTESYKSRRRAFNAVDLIAAPSVIYAPLSAQHDLILLDEREATR